LGPGTRVTSTLGSLTRLKSFFSGALENSELQLKLRREGNFFFLHLLGCDTNGHTNKPASREYIDNIGVVDRGIQKIVQTIESYYREDGRTAYIFTADHGMTDWGSHGTGMDHETMTPLVAWGAGIKQNENADGGQLSLKEMMSSGEKAGTVHVKQADLAPFMATLLGANIPVNSVGLLPHRLLDMHPLDVAKALKAQYSQLLQQYLELRGRHENVHLPRIYHKECPYFTKANVETCQTSIDKLRDSGRYSASINKSLSCIDNVYKGINYYQRYQKNILKALITMTICLSFLAHVITVWRLSSGLPNVTGTESSFSSAEAFILTVLILSWFFQQLPFYFLFYYLAPVYSIRKLKSQLAHATTLLKDCRLSPQLFRGLGTSAVALVFCETLVLSFFERRWLTLGVVLLAASLANRGWQCPIVMLVLLGAFSWLPPIDGRSQLTWLVLGASILYSVAAFFFLSHETERRSKWMLILLNLGAGFCVHYSSTSQGLPITVQLITWTIFILSIPLAVAFSENSKSRVLSLMLGLGSSFSLLSLSYEALFLFCLSLAMLTWIQAETEEVSQKFYIGSWTSLEDEKKEADRSEDVICITRFFFLVFYSFFGTGNIASLNSFDPGSIRCFLSVFNPFLMGGLLLTKILMPILCTCIFFAHIVELRGMPAELVSSVLHLFADFLSLHFFHLVKDSGSWLDIGTSLSHFIIVEGTGVFLLLLLGVARFLVSYKTHSYRCAGKISYD